MELLGLALVWPLILLVIGFVFVTSADVAGWLILLVFLFFVAMIIGVRTAIAPSEAGMSEAEQLDQVRRASIAFAIALLLPIFVKYLLEASGRTLPAMILALAIGFGVLVWGIFTKGNRVLAYANCIGGAFTIIYLYLQLWTLGQLAQIVATAFGLVVAIIISVAKFRDKLS